MENRYGNRSSYNVGFVQKRETLETGNFLDYRDFYLIFDRVPDYPLIRCDL